jgi:hypothetical protein
LKRGERREASGERREAVIRMEGGDKEEQRARGK